ncbi:MAG: 3-phosphoshikimate 1-carboxyvinyltransferase [Bacteroidia bacterium]
MHVILHNGQPIQTTIKLVSSKSISNRALILSHVLKLYGSNKIPQLKNLSNADDTIIMQNALMQNEEVINIKNAGTCLRFLTAYFSSIPQKQTILVCDERMKQRPIEPLVTALNLMGADITYIENKGFAPLKINGKKLNGGTVIIDGSSSSQFASALMLIAPLMKQKLTINFLNTPVSFSYLIQTQKIIEAFGGNTKLNLQNAEVDNKIDNELNEFYIEPDWSSAAFWYMAAALNQNCTIFLDGLQTKSIQGDSYIHTLASFFGVKSTQKNNGILLEHNKNAMVEPTEINLINHPDLAPELICIAAVKNLKHKFIGLQTLQYKESNRLDALIKELSKLGCNFSYTNNSLTVVESINENKNNVLLNTYNDHRLAMAFAMLSLKTKQIKIDNLYVTEKSYPAFISDIKSCSFKIKTES